MKKGFTLVELMMVMVLVGILVAVALPKYTASLERSRAVEGITLLKDVSDYLNTHYVMNGSQYTAVAFEQIDTIKQKNFYEPEISIDNDSSPKAAVVQAERRDDQGWDYTLIAHNENGELKKITCTGYIPDCEKAGAKEVDEELVFDFF